jgi:hypothetical protein
MSPQHQDVGLCGSFGTSECCVRHNAMAELANPCLHPRLEVREHSLRLGFTVRAAFRSSSTRRDCAIDCAEACRARQL